MKRVLLIIAALIIVVILLTKLTKTEPNCNLKGCDFPILIEGYDTTLLYTLNIIKYAHKNNYKNPIDTLRLVHAFSVDPRRVNHASITLTKPLDVTFDYMIIIEKDTFKISEIEMEYKQSWERCFIKKYVLNNTDTGYSNITLVKPKSNYL